MQKFGAFFEKYIEWIAIGLGGIFFLAMIWSYFITKPVVDKLGSEEVTIANVDERVKENSADKLQAEMTSVIPPSFQVEPFSSAVTKGLSMETYQPTSMTATIDFQPVYVPNPNNTQSNSLIPVVEALPKLPKAVAKAVLIGNTSVMLPEDPVAAPVPGANPAAPAAPANPANNLKKKDIEWATVVFTIPSDALASEWIKSFGPAKPNDSWKLPAPVGTAFLIATLWRQERDATGAWGQPQPIARLANNPLPAYPTPKDGVYASAYYQWAKTNMADIITPAFPPIAAAPFGMVWKSPKDPLTFQNQGVPGAPAAPIQAPPIAPPVGSGPRIPANMPGGGGPRGGGPITRQPVTPQPQPTAPKLVTAPQEPSDPTIIMVPGAFTGATPVTPTGAFDPVDLVPAPVVGVPATPSPDIMVYLFDDSIKAGSSYRYTLDYKLYNPLFNTFAERAKDPNWVNQIDLSAPMSDPSPVVTPAAHLFFFCAATTQLDKGKPFPFEIFTWANGVEQRQTFYVHPGDAIGGMSATGVDFSTGYTYLDGRMRNNRFKIFLIDSNGKVIEKDAENDSNSPDRKLHAAQADQAKPVLP